MNSAKKAGLTVHTTGREEPETCFFKSNYWRMLNSIVVLPPSRHSERVSSSSKAQVHTYEIHTQNEFPLVHLEHVG